MVFLYLVFMSLFTEAEMAHHMNELSCLQRLMGDTRSDEVVFDAPTNSFLFPHASGAPNTPLFFQGAYVLSSNGISVLQYSNEEVSAALAPAEEPPQTGGVLATVATAFVPLQGPNVDRGMMTDIFCISGRSADQWRDRSSRYILLVRADRPNEPPAIERVPGRGCRSDSRDPVSNPTHNLYGREHINTLVAQRIEALNPDQMRSSSYEVCQVFPSFNERLEQINAAPVVEDSSTSDMACLDYYLQRSPSESSAQASYFYDEITRSYVFTHSDPAIANPGIYVINPSDHSMHETTHRTFPAYLRVSSRIDGSLQRSAYLLEGTNDSFTLTHQVAWNPIDHGALLSTNIGQTSRDSARAVANQVLASLIAQHPDRQASQPEECIVFEATQPEAAPETGEQDGLMDQ